MSLTNILLKPKFSLLFLLLVMLILAVASRYYMFTWADRLGNAIFQNQLPDIVVAEREKPHNPYTNQYDFTEDWFTENIPIWEKVLAPYIGKPVSYLEVGAFEGGSVVWMLENILTNPESKVTAIDIFNGPFEDRYFKNIEFTGASDKVTTIKNYSQLALRDLPFKSFDIIYIDGSHAKADVLEDAVLAWRLLKENGLLIFDDYKYAVICKDGSGTKQHFPKIALDLFVQCFNDKFEIVHNDYQLILRRIK